METDQYIGVDLHKAFFQVCAMAKTGERQWEGRFPRTPEGIGALIARCTASSAACPDIAVSTSYPRARSSGVMVARMFGSSSTMRMQSATQRSSPTGRIRPGTTIENLAPAPGLYSAHTRPLAAASSPRLIASPIPVPGDSCRAVRPR